MSQFNPTFSNDTDSCNADLNVLLEQLSTLRTKYSAGELSESDLVAWKNPMLVIYALESICRMGNLIGDLQSAILELRQENRYLQDNVGWLNGAVFDSLDDDLEESGHPSVDQEASAPSDNSLSPTH